MGDHECLQAYVSANAQEAFATLVARYVNLVYSAALRQAGSATLAEEIAQAVFVDLARSAGSIPAAQPLAAWLYVVTRRTAVDLLRQERRRIVREHTAAELHAMHAPSDNWPHIRDSVDEAMECLPDGERAAIVLRFFENLSLREVGVALGVSDDAAQKRVTRALDRLRDFYGRRGVAMSAAALGTHLSAHAVHSAPAGLAAGIAASMSTSGAVGAAALGHISGTVVMTTVQKTAIAAVCVILLGTGAYEAAVQARHNAARALLEKQISALMAEQHAIARARSSAPKPAATAPEPTAAANPPVDAAVAAELAAWMRRVDRLKEYARNSGKTIPEMALLPERVWQDMGKDLDRRSRVTSPDEALENAVLGLRSRAAVDFGLRLADACRKFVAAHNGQLPDSTRELRPYLEDSADFNVAAVTDEMLQRYAMRYTGPLSDVPPAERNAVIVETASPDEEHDQRIVSGPTGSRLTAFVDLKPDTTVALQAFTKATGRSAPANASELLPYFNPPLSAFRQQKLMDNWPTLAPSP